MKLPRKRSSDALPYQEDINAIIDCLRELVVQGGRGVRIVRGVNGTTISIDSEKSKGVSIRQFILGSTQNDFYTCYEWDGENLGTEEIYVARVQEHRVSEFNGRTIAYNQDSDSFSATYAYTSPTKRTKTIAGVAEVQNIVPYLKDNFTIIYAMEVDFVMTTGASHEPLTDPNDEPITLLDLNLDGRAWAKA